MPLPTPTEPPQSVDNQASRLQLTPKSTFILCAAVIVFFISRSVLSPSPSNGSKPLRETQAASAAGAGRRIAMNRGIPDQSGLMARKGIEPEATKLLQEMMTAYANLKTYSDTVEVRESSMPLALNAQSPKTQNRSKQNEKPIPPQVRRMALLFARPSKIAVTTLFDSSAAGSVEPPGGDKAVDTPDEGETNKPSADRHPVEAIDAKSNTDAVPPAKTLNSSGANPSIGLGRSVSDGSFFYSIKPSQKGTYLKRPVETGAFGSQALLQYQPAGPLFTAILTGADTLKPPWGRQPVALYLAKPTVVEGEMSDIVVARFDNTDTPGEPETIAYEMSQRDHLLRRLVVNRFIKDKRLIMMESHREVKINLVLSASAFSITAPAGWQAAERLSAPSWNPKLTVGATPFPIEATALDGKPISLQQYAGKPVLLLFWASWCPSCKRELPHIKAAYEEYHQAGFDILAISLDRQQEQLEAFIKKKELPWRQIFDGQSWKSPWVKLYGIRSIPFCLLIGADGKIAAVNPQRLQLVSEIRKTLGTSAQ